MKTITIKRSEMAQLKGLGATLEQMSTHFGVTNKEMKEALIEGGLIKGRKRQAAEPAYVIEYVDDTADIVKARVTDPVSAEA